MRKLLYQLHYHEQHFEHILIGFSIGIIRTLSTTILLGIFMTTELICGVGWACLKDGTSFFIYLSRSWER